MPERVASFAVAIAQQGANRILGYEKNQNRITGMDNQFLTVKKVVWLAIQSASQKWTMPLKDWRMAMSRFIIGFGDRLDGHF